MIRTLGAVLLLGAVAASCGGDGLARARASAVGLAGTVCRTEIRAGGVVVANGVVATAAHVLAGIEGGLEIVAPDGERTPGVVVGFDPERDLALVAAAGLAVPAAELAVAAAGKRGIIVAVEPDGTVREYDFEVLRRINATGDDIYGEGDVARQALELAADIAPGASGAAAFGDDGSVVGIVFAESRSRSVAYAVDATEIEAFLTETDVATPAPAGRCR